MLGYHFTTYDAYQTIKRNGLKPSPLDPYKDMGALREHINDGCIWLYTRDMPNSELLGMVMYVATHHDSDHVVRLLVEYEKWVAATHVAEQKSRDKVRPTHDLEGVGCFGHIRAPVELLLEPVGPENIQLIGDWDLGRLVREGQAA